MTRPDILAATRARWAVTITHDAPAAARLHAELTHRLLGGHGRAGVRTAPGPRYPDPTAIEARRLIRHTLASWCLLVAQERVVALPADELPAMGAYLALHANWLADHEAGQECAEELAALAHGWAWRVCYPTGTRVVPLGRPCPCEGCDGTLRAILRPEGDRLDSEVVCTGNDPHRWPTERWTALDTETAHDRAA